MINLLSPSFNRIVECYRTMKGQNVFLIGHNLVLLCCLLPKIFPTFYTNTNFLLIQLVDSGWKECFVLEISNWALRFFPPHCSLPPKLLVPYHFTKYIVRLALRLLSKQNWPTRVHWAAKTINSHCTQFITNTANHLVFNIYC